MKQILILRHANWDQNRDELTEQGRQACAKLKPTLPHFDIVVCGPRKRTSETAQLLTDSEPVIDERAGTITLSAEQRDKLDPVRQSHPLGIVGALWSFEEFHKPLQEKGTQVLQLVMDVFDKLPPNGNGLIVSHDGVLVALEKVIQHESFDTADHTFPELGGYWIDEHMNLRKVEKLVS